LVVQRSLEKAKFRGLIPSHTFTISKNQFPKRNHCNWSVGSVLMHATHALTQKGKGGANLQNGELGLSICFLR
jgi:hypothetical protein